MYKNCRQGFPKSLFKFGQVLKGQAPSPLRTRLMNDSLRPIRAYFLECHALAVEILHYACRNG